MVGIVAYILLNLPAGQSFWIAAGTGMFSFLAGIFLALVARR